MMGPYLCLFYFATVFVLAQLDIRDACGPDGKGTCVLVEGCSPAVDQIKSNRHHNFERCGWKGDDEIVCCILMENRNPTAVMETRTPTAVTETSNPTAVRKSVESCIQYGREPSANTVQEFIYNGFNASLGDYPHMAALGYDSDNQTFPYSWDCAGSLISKNYVLTAAHCMVRRPPAMIRLGKIDLYGDDDKVDPQDIPVARSFPHPEYDHIQRKNDIALIQLVRDVKFTSNAQPICLYTEPDVPTGLYISGWGYTDRSGQGSRFLQQAAVEPVDLVVCNETLLRTPFINPVLDTQLCALGRGKNVTDTCKGDSGGPIQVQNRKLSYGTQFFLIGVTSRGRGCPGSTPGVYTRVSSYIDWIEKNVWP